MIEIKKYSSEQKNEWNDFVKKAKNATFLFHRDYMDYHADRFEDCSLFITKNEKIIALFPANIHEQTVYSHQGLTYGGVILSSKSTTIEILDIFETICSFFRKNGITKLIYKPLPYIYATFPAQEDIYALFRLNAKKIACNISSTINQSKVIPFIESRKSGVRKAKKNDLIIKKADQFNAFWDILNDNLQTKYDKKPVHSLEEITLLKERFPENIEQYLVLSPDQKPLAGTLMYITDQVAHVQYISSTIEGRNAGALDLLFDYLINDMYKHIPYFDFGQSTEEMGEYLNENLIFQKEGFGGRGVVYETYEITL